MKFFLKPIITIFKKKYTHTPNNYFKDINGGGWVDYNNSNELSSFSRFLTKNGNLIKEKHNLSLLLTNINYLMYTKISFLCDSYPNVRWIIEDLLQKKLTFLYIFNVVINLIKPPFVVKSIIIPKKLRKKTKQKYLIKIVYKNDNKRLKSSYKQLYYYSNKFSDSKFNVRLYKSLIFSFLDWKSSYLFKLKSMVFKKFFKF